MTAKTIFIVPVLLALTLLPLRAQAQSTPSLMGPLGLNTVPNARMDPAGTIRAAGSTMDPYLNVQLGLQIAAPLYVALRQTAEVSSIFSRATRLYPGIDTKLRLHAESPVAPEISVGLQSAFGAKRTAGEYLVLSKRAGDFDFTGGIGWGRNGGIGHLPNPFGFLSHFKKNRDPESELPNNMSDWFTGKDVGLFGGVEYFPPFLDKVSLKADIGGDSYSAEKAASDYHAPQPWSVGLSYRPFSWVSFGTAFVGGNKVMGTVSLQGPLGGWPGRAATLAPPIPLDPARSGDARPAAMERAAAIQRQTLYNADTEKHTAWAMLDVDGNASLPQQIGRAVRPMANNAGTSIEEINIIPMRDGLRGPVVSLNRRDLEAALARHEGSPQEIWRHADIGKQDMPSSLYGSKWSQPFRDENPAKIWSRFHLTLDQQASVSEKDAGLLYRTSLIAELQQQVGTHAISGAALRLNIADNLEQLEEIRPRPALPVRSDVDRFARQRVGLDRLYSSWLTSLTPSIHFAASAGLLEEMYSGAGAEILYRPFGKTFAIGAEAWEALKRDPLVPLALGLDGDHILSAHINAWYEIPDTDLTLQAKFGRYLAGDIGGTLALEKNLDNGVKVRGFVTATNRADYDVFGGATNVYSGVELTFPLGNSRYIPNGSALRLAAEALGRDSGQTLDNPLPLYQLTEPMSARQIIRHWNDIVQ